ncbi:amino acid ABC transporter ATP-binding protein (plasmid) [Entomospira nematocerorum]|uniref:Amino acid ABC transporter ATP-binding protein n=1 Tax=Entomospira nematocerorum TaxID=2719987 RepID=A0A968GD89_9SPIO|nr:amino acid ABC transporter ATP-binding protein [Entomospira nematocera]NIZ47654.1 amino acid ABC transporter ATP-binding protein [Entomospira nematocera]WDI34546.1 amino acid ABC transporter ATP-binding protein [Entomospira nematocera]
MQEILRVEHLRKSFGAHQVLNDINFSMNKGDVITLIGSSGSGKSTLLRCLNLLEEADGGAIIFHDTDLLASHVDINKMRQSMGMVFQSFNLFDNYTVLGNCTLAPLLTKRMTDRKEAEALAMTYLKKVGMDDFAHMRVTRLSGGQKQRVAIARALCMQGDILLFDEPTSALDPESVGEVLKVMKELAREGLSMVVVTHEMSFARDVANRILFMSAGDIIEDATPQELFTNPKDERTKQFLSRFIN